MSGEAPIGLAEIRRYYGDVKIQRTPSGWRIAAPAAWESANCTLIGELPGLGKRRLWCNTRIVEPLRAALLQARRDAPDYVVRTIGCFAVRPKRVVSKPGEIVGWPSISFHAVAAAVDINADRNPQAPPGSKTLTTDLPDAFVRAFEDHGWTWGGRFPRPDAMHFQWGSGA